MYKLLIADDEYEIRNGLHNYFPWNEVGFENIGVMEDGKKVLSYIKNAPVDVILSDIKMPLMDGIELAREVYEQKMKIKIIFLSGYRDFEYAQKAIIYGVKNYIIKPTKYNELIEVFTRIKEELDSENASRSENPVNLQQEHIDDSHNSNNMVINTIKNYVNLHYCDVTLEDISKLIHMNFQYVSKFFKQKTGQNFSDYLIEVRMKKAIELLKDYKNKTYEVSDILGYSNPKNFTRTFKSYYGVGPREYRNSNSYK